MRAYDVKKIIDINGDMMLSELFERMKNGNQFECPKCEGKGYTTKMVNTYPSGLPDSGWVQDLQPVDKDCDICNGIGYTRKQMKPKIKTEIIGYE